MKARVSIVRELNRGVGRSGDISRQSEGSQSKPAIELEIVCDRIRMRKWIDVSSWEPARVQGACDLAKYLGFSVFVVRGERRFTPTAIIKGRFDQSTSL